MTPSDALEALERVIDDCGDLVVACSGGIDSLLLATVAHLHRPAHTTVAHTVTPAVPADGTARVKDHAQRNGWRLEVVRSREFEDERYLANPTDRCYFCKTNLYDAIDELRRALAPDAAVIVSGANVDDLGEYRPGLIAAAEHGVRHPFLEAELGKAEIRMLAAHLGLEEADLPASPCLASRLYTGTRVTAERLRAVERGEEVLRRAGFPVVRCRRRDGEVRIEVPEADRPRLTADLVAEVHSSMRSVDPDVDLVVVDDRPYRPGQAILAISKDH